MFDDIRPFVDAEIPAAMQRIAGHLQFPTVSRFLFPREDPAQVGAQLCTCRTISDFQMSFMYPAISSIMQKTTGGVSVTGLESLDPKKHYLFISNHRDIVLDAAFLQVLLTDAHLPTTEITFGANLMQGEFITDIGKSNKMFRVERPTTVASAREFLLHSFHLSEYIRYTLLEKGESIWIAQRNGRTKDGDDRTDRGIVTMLMQSGREDRVAALSELNIVPISISYEWEPCDVLKALELYARSSGEPYTKHPGEDLNSILTGIMQPKGRVHLSVAPPMDERILEPFCGLPKGELTTAVAALIDEWVHTRYHLFPNNYIAWDLLHGSFSGQYTEAEKEAFMQHLSQLDRYEDAVTLRSILLRIYANPVANARKYSEVFKNL
ncbi:MAG: 1-acyl-sn-glycerol-3-phosphate acyltransferase [Bacteroidales bacterium]|nr:1-acyl-sn-glycerol-3-phosphate acyltransferase [Bacteroidales bacterium]